MPILPHTGYSGGLSTAFSTIVQNTPAESTPTNESTVPFTYTLIQNALRLTARSGLGSFTSVNSAGILATHQRHIIQVMAASMACFSITASIFAIYWFCMMRRNYRRDLVLLLILADFYKSLWYLVYGGVSFVQGQVKSSQPFCQVTGFMLQTGLEACDFAILFISMHMHLQVFPPKANSWLGNEGLYKIRFYVFGAWVLVPIISASLAFINPHGAYQAQGAFCWLPIRPFWYRLALSWVPRYMDWAYVMFVAVRIYSHVGFEFKVFAHEQGRGTDSQGASTNDSSFDDLASAASKSTKSKPKLLRNISEKIYGDSVAPDDMSLSTPSKNQRPEMAQTPVRHLRRASLPAWSDAFMVDGSLSPITEVKTSAAVAEEGRAGTADNRAMKKRRRQIQRQLRILFIYPVVYMFMWVLPFVSHCMSYSDHYAQHPVFAISFLSSFCQTTMGFVDVCIFCWRERPWRHIPGSDGTFIGSFTFWRFWQDPDFTRRVSQAPKGVVGQPPSSPSSSARSSTGEKAGSQSSLLGWFKRLSNAGRKPSSAGSRSRRSTTTRISAPNSARQSMGNPMLHKRAFSGGGEKKFREFEQAHERLALERADWESRKAEAEEKGQPLPGSPGHEPQRREWFDRQFSESGSSTQSIPEPT